MSKGEKRIKTANITNGLLATSYAESSPNISQCF